MKDIEQLIKKLKMLAEIPSLSKAGNEEVTNTMKKLKAAGMSSGEISEASDGRWSPSTVKGRTKGVKAHGSSIWQTAVGLLSEIIAADISLDDLQSALAVRDDLDSSGIEVHHMIDIIAAVDASTVELESFVKHV